MESPRRRLILGGTAMLAVRGRGAMAQGVSGFPDRPVRIVVPFAPGGITDILARAAADRLSPLLGQPVVVENRAGAGGNIGSEAVAKAPADGHVLLAVGPAVMGIAKPLHDRLNYDPDTDFTCLGLFGAQANVMLVSPRALPEPTLAAFLAAARAKPGEVAFGSSGNGSLTHLTVALLAADAGLRLVHVPYRGSPPALADLAGGQISMMFDAVTTALPLHQGGQARIVGTATDARIPDLPDVPSLVEAGFPSLDAVNWFGLFAPVGVPGPVQARLRAALTQVVNSDGYRILMRGRNAQPVELTGRSLEDFLAGERRRWADAVARSGARAG